MESGRARSHSARPLSPWRTPALTRCAPALCAHARRGTTAATPPLPAATGIRPPHMVLGTCGRRRCRGGRRRTVWGADAGSVRGGGGKAAEQWPRPRPVLASARAAAKRPREPAAKRPREAKRPRSSICGRAAGGGGRRRCGGGRGRGAADAAAPPRPGPWQCGTTAATLPLPVAAVAYADCTWSWAPPAPAPAAGRRRPVAGAGALRPATFCLGRGALTSRATALTRAAPALTPSAHTLTRRSHRRLSRRRAGALLLSRRRALVGGRTRPAQRGRGGRGGGGGGGTPTARVTRVRRAPPARTISVSAQQT